MKKTILMLILALFAQNMAHAYIDQYGKRHYHVALVLTSPLGLISKGGAAIENRYGQTSYLVNYTKYWGVYAGTQYGYELQHFLRPSYRSKNFLKPHEYFIYLKGMLGDASYDSKKLAVIGDNSNIYIGPNLYGGVGAGFGRRYNFKFFFMSWKVGLKYSALIDNVDDLDKHLYRLFFVTGPGSIVDANFHFGIQL